MDRAEELYGRLIAPIEEKMMATVARIVRHPDDAGDVFQEVLGVVWRKLRTIDRHPNPSGYILRVCVSRSYDALRRRVRRREVSLEPGSAEAIPARADPPQDAGEALSIRRAIGALPPRQAQALLLRAVDGSPYGAIGEILGCSEATARSHVSKGRARLLKLLIAVGIMKPGEA